MVLFSSYAFAGLQYLTKSIEPQTAFENPITNWNATDDDSLQVALGFDFLFNGNTYTQLWINSNGMLSFNSSNTTWTNSQLSFTTEPQSIYPYWDDLNPANGGSITYGTVGFGDTEHFVVSWNSIPHYPSNGSYSFQVVLYKNGDIRFRYDSASDVDGSSATIGVQENTSNFDQHLFDAQILDATKDILYTSTQKLTTIVPTCSSPISKIKMTTYDTTGYNSYPSDSTTYATLIQNYGTVANLFGSGYLNQINGSNNPYGSNENYLSIFEGYIYLPTTGIYKFGIDGDDAVEVYIDDRLITGWYGGHGRANEARSIVTVFAEAGWHKLKYHHQERGGGDYYYLYWQKPNGNMEIVRSTQFFNCDTAQMSVVKSSCVLDDYVNSTANAKRIPGAKIRFAIEVKNEGSSSAENVVVSDTLSNEFDATSIQNLQIQDGACDCLGVATASNNGANGTADGVNPVTLDFGTVLSGSNVTPTVKCGYFEVGLQ